jgi:UDP-2-acetamido-3-amino-2,3-dideoxy-glucuronate N-acetyltransferase
MMPSQNSVVLAQLGCGYWGPNLLRNFSSLPGCSVKWVAEPSPQQRQFVEQKYPQTKTTARWEEAVADPEVQAVVIATPAATHFAMTKQALLAGKDVFVEKPMAMRRAEGEELASLAAERQRILMVGHVLQYHPAIQKLNAMIHSGELGKLQYIYSNRLNIGKIRTEENILWSFAPHDISVMLMLLGEFPASVCAHGGNYLHHDLPDVTMTTLTFGSGARGHIFVSWLHPHKEQRLVVVGDKKMVVFNDAAERDKLVSYAHQVEWIDRKPVAKKAAAEPITIAAEEPLKLECAHFLDCMATRKPPRTDATEGLAVLTVLEACQKSLDQQGATIPLSSTAAARRYFLHESSYADEPSEIGEGTKIWHFSHVLKGSKIGKNCNIGQNVVIGPNVTIGNKVKIQNNVSVYQGVTLEDEVFCGPSMVFTNVINPRSGIVRMHELKDTLVKKSASIGANATILCGHTIGAYSFIGAGAVVTKDVPDYALVVGNPARVVGWMCQCGVRLEFDGDRATCTACSSHYEKNGQSIQPRS